MSIYCPEKYKTNFLNKNLELLKLAGELDDINAQISLANFLSYNIGFTMDLISGVKPALYQEILMKSVLNRNFSMLVACRGGSKSTMAAWLSFWISLFEPGSNILLSGPTFRCSRNIFNTLEKIVKSKDATLLRQCFTENPSRRNDEFFWKINNGTIRAVPLSNDRIRGFRATTIFIDEFLLLSEDVVKTVLQPFLIAPSNIKERMEITEREDRLIKEGVMKESERTIFNSTARMVALTSASYTFEYAYQVYQEWISKIYDTETVQNAKYFVANVSYEALPTYMVEQSVIEEAKRGDEVHPAFKREYCAQFIDGSDSYFSAKRMHQLTLKNGERPTTLIRGNPSKEYILSIDPNFSQSTSADHFAMSVLEINREEEKAILVHNYAKAGVELKEHIAYFYYLLTAFNIVMVIADNADGNFIQSANESVLFQKNNIKLDFIDYDGELVGEDYIKMLKECRNQYNFNAKRICFKHVFNQQSIRRINEQLQTWINTNKIFFASKLTQNEQDYEEALRTELPIEIKNQSMSEFVADLISDQDDLMYQTKKECALIEVRVSPSGGQVFDLPQALKRNTSPNRARKDSYTALMLGIEGVKSYLDIMRQNTNEEVKMFTPAMFGQTTFRK